jgi:NAD(P)-dependent dehydrogenase (short-subunit alcohol dehydrogenase family)
MISSASVASRICPRHAGPEAPRPAGRLRRRVFLASDDARWITGDTIRVDGDSKLLSL